MPACVAHECWHLLLLLCSALVSGLQGRDAQIGMLLAAVLPAGMHACVRTGSSAAAECCATAVATDVELPCALCGCCYETLDRPTVP
jgi:hypothetical protein